MPPATLQPYQQRVLTERDELRVKFTALGRWLTLEPTDARLPPEERALLSTQYSIMNAYLQLLEMRIARWACTS